VQHVPVPGVPAAPLVAPVIRLLEYFVVLFPVVLIAGALCWGDRG
jgi:hypothetical protein